MKRAHDGPVLTRRSTCPRKPEPIPRAVPISVRNILISLSNNDEAAIRALYEAFLSFLVSMPFLIISRAFRKFTLASFQFTMLQNALM